jgi:outer membrane protein assembly factor BamA
LRRLNSSGYFASAQGAIDTDPANAENSPVRIAVIEAPTKRLEGGVGYSTDVRYRANASYRDVDINGKALQFLAEGASNRKRRISTCASRSRQTNAAGSAFTARPRNAPTFHRSSRARHRSVAMALDR